MQQCVCGRWFKNQHALAIHKSKCSTYKEYKIGEECNWKEENQINNTSFKEVI